MSTTELKHASSPSQTYLLVPILLLFVLLVIAVLRSPSLISNVGIGSAVIVASPLILATYALTIIAMAGRVGVDLSIGPLIGFLNVTMVQLYGAEFITTPVDFFAYAIAVGVLYQLLMGLIIVYVRVQPIIVALSGFLALSGLNLVILPRPGGIAPEWMQPWGLGTEILSPVLWIVVAATLVWFALSRSAFFGHLRLMGADERTAYASGVRINLVRLGAHVIAGVYAAMAALTFTSLISSGDPNQGTTYTLMAVTALVLGGTSLAGGRGSIVGSLFGALNIYLITYVLSTFSFGRVQSFVTDAAYGVVLVISLLLTLALPRLPQGVARFSPAAFFVFLGVIAFGVILYAKDDLIAPPTVAESPGFTVLGGEADESSQGAAESETGLTVLGAEPESSSDSGLTVLGAEPESAGESGLTVLGADDDTTGLTVLGAEPSEAEPAAPRGTAIVYAGIVIGVVVFLIYLLYRRLTVSLVAFIGVLLLMVLGLSLYGGPDLQAASTAVHSQAMAGMRTFVLEWTEAYGISGAIGGSDSTAGLRVPPLVGAALIVAGTVLLGSLLIVIAQKNIRARIGNVPLLFLIGLGALAVLVTIYANQGISAQQGGLFTPAIGAVLVGALLFVVSLPRVQERIGNATMVPLVILSITALGAMYFAAAADSHGAVRAVTQAVSGAPAATAAIEQLQPSETLLGALFWVILAAAALYIGTLPLVRRKILAYVAESIGVRAVSYTSAFIVLSAVLILGAMVYVAEAPLWKFGVAIVAAIIAARYLWRFFLRYRGGGFLLVAKRELVERGVARQSAGARR